MRTKERIREVNDVVGDRMKREAAKVAGLAPSAELVRTLARDEDVRAAAREVLSRAEKVRGELNHDGRMGRLARDPKLQSDVAALVRSAAGALDATVVAGKRRARRRVFRFVFVGAALAAVGVWLNQQRAARAEWNQVEQAGGSTDTGIRAVQPVGVGAGSPGTAGGSKPTPAEAAEKVESEGPTG